MKIDYDVAWGSHLPVLMKVMQETKGPVLELGAGLYSTPFLFWMCKDQKRVFHSYENSLDWFKLVWNIKDIRKDGFNIQDEFNTEVVASRHNITDTIQANYVKDWDWAHIENEWDVVLIDHSPSRRRIVDIKILANQAKFMVIHDTQRNYKFCNYNEIWSLFKYRYDYKKAEPHTSVVSNFVNVERMFI